MIPTDARFVGKDLLSHMILDPDGVPRYRSLYYIGLLHGVIQYTHDQIAYTVCYVGPPVR
jgi:hypothetical protein